MKISKQAIEAVIALGQPSEYLSTESYSVPEWENLDELKSGFPTTKEGIQLTNGIETIDAHAKAIGSHAANTDDEIYFACIMRLKSSHPELPVYEIHNHPSVEGYIQSGFFFDSGEDDGEDGWKQTQRLVASVPSQGDIRRWNSIHNLVGAGIYVQDLNEVRVFREGDERNKTGSILAIEHDENYNPLNAYWASEEGAPMTEYIKPEEWQEKKDRWLPYFNKMTFAAPWAK